MGFAPLRKEGAEKEAVCLGRQEAGFGPPFFMGRVAPSKNFASLGNRSGYPMFHRKGDEAMDEYTPRRLAVLLLPFNPKALPDLYLCGEDTELMGTLHDILEDLIRMVADENDGVVSTGVLKRLLKNKGLDRDFQDRMRKYGAARSSFFRRMDTETFLWGELLGQVLQGLKDYRGEPRMFRVSR